MEGGPCRKDGFTNFTVTSRSQMFVTGRADGTENGEVERGSARDAIEKSQMAVVMLSS